MSWRFSQASRVFQPLAVVVTAASVTCFRPTPVGGREVESVLRKKIAWQAGLDATGISPGLIDGRVGPKTQLATREFQRRHGLPATGELDQATADAWWESYNGSVQQAVATGEAEVTTSGPSSSQAVRAILGAAKAIMNKRLDPDVTDQEIKDEVRANWPTN